MHQQLFENYINFLSASFFIYYYYIFKVIIETLLPSDHYEDGIKKYESYNS